MAKKANKSKRPKDKYYQLAKEQGYRARSAFKLIQLNKKYDFLAKASVCIDLCAAPGGWLQVAAKYMPSGSTIIGIDLVPVKAIRGVITHQEDITTPQCRSLLKRDLQGQKADVILHDGAPNVGQSWIKDAFTQSELVLCALKLATEFLRPHGSFITKVFRSSDYNSLLWVFHQFFAKVEATKPLSSRTASAEIFVTCKDYKAPDKIDPRLLDSKYVFKDIDDLTGSGAGVAGGGGSKAIDVMHSKAGEKVRHRDGYDDSLGPLLTRRMSVTAFIRSDEPIRVLTDASALVFDEDALASGYSTHQDTTDDIRACCDDLKVLGKKEFKDLLKWRYTLRRAFPRAVKPPGLPTSGMDAPAECPAAAAEEDGGGAGSESDDEVDSDVAMLSEAAKSILARNKRDTKRQRRQEAKALRRQRLGMHLRNVDLLGTEMNLFDLSKLKKMAGGGDDAMEAIRNVDLERAEEMGRLDDVENGGATPEDGGGVSAAEAAGIESDSDLPVIEKLREADAVSRLDDIEEEVDTAYAAYLAKKQMREAEAREAVSKGKSASPGIRLSRRHRLEQQAYLTEAALNGRLDAEHQKYLQLLGDTRKQAEAETEMAAANSDHKRKRVPVCDSDEYSTGDDSESEVDVPNEATQQHAPLKSETKAARWFSQPMFADAFAEEQLQELDETSRGHGDDHKQESEGSDSELDIDPLGGLPKSERDKRRAALRKRREKTEKARQRASLREDIQVVVGNNGPEIDDDFDRIAVAAAKETGAFDGAEADVDTELKSRAKRDLIRAGMGATVKGSTAGNEDDGTFDVVPADAAGNGKEGDAVSVVESHDPRDDYYDSDTHAEMLAIGKMLHRHSTAKELLDASYNRYTFDDEGLPQWFKADEGAHFRPQLPISASEVAKIKASLRDIAARPIAKVAEARARKRRRLDSKMLKANKQAESIMETEEMAQKSKRRALAKLYKGTAAKRPSSVYVIGKTGKKVSKGGKGARTKLVDPRLKKDKRAMKAKTHRR